MLFQEARWIGATLSAIPAEQLSPVLSIGSGNRDFRARRQPWVDDLVYTPLERRGVTVLHHELEAAEGVDVSGDLTDPAVQATLRELGVKSLMCCNVLEHLPHPAELARQVVEMTEPAGIALFTVPRRFPYHPDPIDTMFRPTPAEVAQLVPDAHLEQQAVVRCDSLLRYWLRSGSKRQSFVNGLRSVRPGPRTAPARSAPARPPGRRLDTIAMAVGRTEVSCAVFRRRA